MANADLRSSLLLVFEDLTLKAKVFRVSDGHSLPLMAKSLESPGSSREVFLFCVALHGACLASQQIALCVL